MGNIFSFSNCFSNNVRVKTWLGKKKMRPFFNSTHSMGNLTPLYGDNLISSTDLQFDNIPPHFINHIASPLDSHYTQDLTLTSNNKNIPIIDIHEQPHPDIDNLPLAIAQEVIDEVNNIIQEQP
jgi:hypothetical protein